MIFEPHVKSIFRKAIQKLNSFHKNFTFLTVPENAIDKFILDFLLFNEKEMIKFSWVILVMVLFLNMLWLEIQISVGKRNFLVILKLFSFQISWGLQNFPFLALGILKSTISSVWVFKHTSKDYHLNLKRMHSFLYDDISRWSEIRSVFIIWLLNQLNFGTCLFMGIKLLVKMVTSTSQIVILVLMGPSYELYIFLLLI